MVKMNVLLLWLKAYDNSLNGEPKQERPAHSGLIYSTMSSMSVGRVWEVICQDPVTNGNSPTAVIICM